MEFERLLELVGNEPVFDTALLLAGSIDPDLVRLQLTRWTKSGRLYQLRRGLYALAPPYQKVRPHPFLVANRLQPASYVSLQSALAYYHIIPDIVQSTLSVTAGRPERLETPLGVYEFRHIKPELLRGYRALSVGGPDSIQQQALVASPDKALLDLVYLSPGGDRLAYLEGLRLQNLDQLELKKLIRLTQYFHSKKIDRAVQVIITLKRKDTEEYQNL